jgi:two-component system sensor histidine kinase PhoQ
MISLNARIGLSAALVLGVFIVLTALALERAFRESAESVLRERLQAQLYFLMGTAELDRDGRLSMPAQLAEPRLNLPQSGLYAAIRSPDGRVSWRSSSAVGASTPLFPMLEVGEAVIARVRQGDQEYYLSGLGVAWEVDDAVFPLTFAVAEDVGDYEAQIASYRHSLWGWLTAMAVLLLSAQILVLRWGLRPLRTVARELEAIEAGTKQRLERDYPKELGRLTDNLNALLAHERAQQTRYKNALADLAHSLKTPLAVLRGLASEGDCGGRSDALLDQQVSRMDGIVQYQLQRAVTKGRSALSRPVAVGAVVGRIVATLDKVYRDKGVGVQRDIAADAVFRGAEGDLMEILGNLLDNAYKWCRHSVQVSAQCGDGALTISVDDDGPGLDPQALELVLERGGRTDESMPGQGIGLAMVREIAQAYGGRVGFSGSPLGGAAVQVTLPTC